MPAVDAGVGFRRGVRVILALAVSVQPVRPQACPSRCSGSTYGQQRLPPLPGGSLPFQKRVMPDEPEAIGDHTFMLHNLLSPAECKATIRAAEASSFSPERIYFGYRRDEPAVSSRSVQRFEDPALSSALAARIQVRHRSPSILSHGYESHCAPRC